MIPRKLMHWMRECSETEKSEGALALRKAKQKKPGKGDEKETLKDKRGRGRGKTIRTKGGKRMSEGNGE